MIPECAMHAGLKATSSIKLAYIESAHLIAVGIIWQNGEMQLFNDGDAKY